MTTNKPDGRAANRPGPLARPTVKRVELDNDVAAVIRNACVIRYGEAGAATVREYVNSLLRQALGVKPHEA